MGKAGIIQRARDQKPLVKHAWRITASSLRFLDGTLPSEDVERVITKPKSKKDQYHVLGKFWLSNLYPVRRAFFMNPQGLFPEVYHAFIDKKLAPILKDVGDKYSTELKVIEYTPYHRDGGAMINVGSAVEIGKLQYHFIIIKEMEYFINLRLSKLKKM